MTPSELSQLIAQKEGTKLDFKRDLHEDSLRDLAKDFAAFANSDGGLILVGVDNGGDILGVDWSPGKTASVQQQGSRCNPKIQPIVTSVKVPKKGTVVVIEISRSTSIHQDDHQRFPFRIGSSSVYMDAALLLQIARTKGLITGDTLAPPTPPRKRRAIKRLSFLGGYLSDPNPAIRAEALKDIGSVSYNYSVEHIPDLQDKLLSLLDDESREVRLNALNLIATTYYRTKEGQRKRLQPRMQEKIESLARKDPDLSVRNRSIYLLCEAGTSRSIGLIIEIIRSEPENSYQTLGVSNGFKLLVDLGLGYDLRRRLYNDLASENIPEIQARLKQALDVLRNMYWEK